MTRGELKTFILERLGVSSSRAAFVTQIENGLYRDYVRLARELELTLDVAQVAITAADRYVDMPNDFLRARTIRIGKHVLREITPDEMAQIQAAIADSQDSQDPQRYIFSSPDRILLDYAPAATDASGCEVVYIVKPAAWTTDADIPDQLPEEYHELLGEMRIAKMALNQEEFSGHYQGAKQEEANLRTELEEALVARSGDGTTRIVRRHYG